jgi:hypothetical protein
MRTCDPKQFVWSPEERATYAKGRRWVLLVDGCIAFGTSALAVAAQVFGVDSALTGAE